MAGPRGDVVNAPPLRARGRELALQLEAEVLHRAPEHERRVLAARVVEELDRLDVQDVPPVGLVADHASEHRFRHDSGGAELDHAVTLSSLTTAKKNMPGA